MPQPNPTPVSVRVVLTLFFAGWFAGGIGCVSMAASAAIHQLRSSTFSRAPGRILESSVAGHADEGARLHVRYAYGVGGKEHIGTVYRHGATSGPAWPVENLVAELPAGKVVDVYYDPAAPHDALLQPGVGVEDLFNFLFAAPFNAIWIVGVLLWWNVRRQSPELGRIVEDDGVTARISTTFWSPEPVAAGIGGLAAALALGVDLLLAAFFGNPHSVLLVSAAWTLVLIATVVAYLRRRSFLAAGHCEIVVDRKRRTVTVPALRNSPTSERQSIPWQTIRGFQVEEFEERDSVSYRCRINSSEPDGTRSSVTLLDSVPRAEAQSLAVWLRHQIGLADGPKVAFRS